MGYGDFAAAAKRMSGGRGVDVVYDGVGKDTFTGSLDSLRPRGMMVLYGGASGQVPPFDLQVPTHTPIRTVNHSSSPIPIAGSQQPRLAVRDATQAR